MRQSALLLMLYLSVAAGSVPAKAANAAMDKQLQAAYAKLHNGQFNDVREICAKNIKAEKNKAEWYALDALSIAYAHKPARPQTADKAVKAAGKNTHVLAVAGFVCALCDDPHTGESLAEQALALNKNEALAHAVLALCLAKTGEPGSGSDLQKALKLAPKDFEVICCAAEHDKKALDSQKALERFDDLVKTYPHAALAYYRRAQFKRDMMEKVGSIDDFGKAVECNANFSEAWGVYSKMLHNLARYKEAVPALTKTIENGSGGIAYLRRGDCYYHLKQYDKAMSDFSEGLRGIGGPNGDKEIDVAVLAQKRKSLEDYCGAWMQRVHCYEKMGKLDLAIADTTRLVVAFPKDLNAVFERQKLYQKQGKYKDALKDLNFLIARAPTIAQWYAARSQVQKQLGHTDEAQLDMAQAKHIEQTGSLK